MEMQTTHEAVLPGTSCECTLTRLLLVVFILLCPLCDVVGLPINSWWLNTSVNSMTDETIVSMTVVMGKRQKSEEEAMTGLSTDITNTVRNNSGMIVKSVVERSQSRSLCRESPRTPPLPSSSSPAQPAQ